MIQRSRSGRRLLTYPAVHPCEAIAPATLLSSLITLSQSILSYKSEFFASNKRNAREIIRQIEALLLFLEEVRDASPGLPDSVVLSFSELHLTLQKVRFLMEDCTTEGARLWMLIKCEQVAELFGAFDSAMATAFDVLPLRDLDISSEVKDLVEMLMRQARKAAFQVDSGDKKMAEMIFTILNRFEDGLDSEKDELKRILDHSRIRSWSQCNKEVKFLESEIEFESLNTEDKRSPSKLELLSSLMGFVCYCRSVVFDSIDGEDAAYPRGSGNRWVLRRLNSDNFRCPISLEFMMDPVTISSGHTYDRSSITKWLKAGNFSCPNTGEKLKSKYFVPNVALKRLIKQYLFENGIPVPDSRHRNRDIKGTVVPGSLAARESMKLLSTHLVVKLAAGTSQEKSKASSEIRILSKTSIFNRSCLVDSGTIPYLLLLLTSRDESAQENAMAALLNLSKHSKGKRVIVENGGLYVIVDVLNKGIKEETKHLAAATLFYLAAVENYRELIGEIPEAIPALMELIKDGSDRGKKNALVAVYGLLGGTRSLQCNHWRVLASGAVLVLITLLSSSHAKEEIVTNALAILTSLAEKPDGSIAILRRPQALPLVVGIISCSAASGVAKEHCASLLLALCNNGGREVVALLVKSPSLMGSLYSLLSEGTSRASKKASALIRLFHEFSERSSSDSVSSSVLFRERSVPAW